jgi:hypothetical protein
LQQSDAVVQSCPNVAHVHASTPMSTGGGVHASTPGASMPGASVPMSTPASCGPASGIGGGGGGMHVPARLPGTMMHAPPGQQSAFVVHDPIVGTQTLVKQVSTPPGPAVHGLPLQQSALVEHVPPGLLHVLGPQRGMPRLSRLQVDGVPWQLPAQQSQRALHELVAVRHTLPFGWHPVGS